MKKEFFWSTVSFLILLLVSFFIFLTSKGLFTPVVFEKVETAAIYYCVKESKGNYNLTADIQEEVFKSLNANGVENSIGIGIFFDKPGSVEKSQQRFMAGSVIPDPSSIAPEAYKYLTEKKGYKIEKLAYSHFLRSDFDFTNGSKILFLLAKAKGYHELTKIIDEKNYTPRKIIELTDMSTVDRKTGDTKKETYSILFPLLP